MYWRIGTITSKELGFSRFDNIGQGRQNEKQGATTVKQRYCYCS